MVHISSVRCYPVFLKIRNFIFSYIFYKYNLFEGDNNILFSSNKIYISLRSYIEKDCKYINKVKIVEIILLMILFNYLSLS